MADAEREEIIIKKKPFMSLMELGRRIHAGEITLEDALREMKEGSSSVLLNWSEDDGDLWECSWIVGGVQAVVKCMVAIVGSS